MIELLYAKLDELWNGTIESFEINFFNHSISIKLSNIIGGETLEHQVDFEGVSSFYYVAGDDDLRFDPGEWERIELTEIVFRSNGEMLKHFRSTGDFQPENITSANFALGIWSTTVLI